MTTVYTGGTFDLFHAGHVAFLKKCAAIGSVVVSLNTDQFIERFKGKPPVITYSQRAVVLEACRYVDRVIVNEGGADSKPAIERVKPQIIAIGSDWRDRDYFAQMQFTQDWLDERGIALVYLTYTSGISSTLIRQGLS